MSQPHWLLFIDGSPLKYRYPIHTDWERPPFRTYKPPRSAFRKKEKTHLPAVEVNSSGTRLVLLVADYDEPREHDGNPFIKYGMSYADLRAVFRGDYPNAIVTSTPSDRAKIFFVIELPAGAKWSKAIALATLKSLLKPQHFEWADHNSTALDRFFVTEAMSDELEARLSSLVPIPAVVPVNNGSVVHREKERDSLHGVNTQTESTSPPSVEKDFKKYSRSIARYSALVKFINSGHPATRNAREALIRLLIPIRNLIGEGFGLPCELFADKAGCCRQTLSGFLHELIDLELLSLVNEYTYKGEKPKARTYLAKGTLFRAIRDRSPKARPKPPLPTHIEDGKWNKTLLYVRLTHFLDDPEGFEAWALTLPTLTAKSDRIDEVINLRDKTREELRDIMAKGARRET